MRLCMASRKTPSNNMIVQLPCLDRGGQSIQEGHCHIIDATFARANSTAICDPALAGLQFQPARHRKICKLHQPGIETRVTWMATMYSTTRPLMPMSSRIMLQQFSTSQVIASTYQCPCHWRPLILVPVNPNRFTTPTGKRQRGGIEPLHVSMPRELKSRPSTSPTHPGC